MDQNSIYDNNPEEDGIKNNNATNNVPEGYTAPDTSSTPYASSDTSSQSHGYGSNNTSVDNNQNNNFNNNGYNPGNYNTPGAGYTPHNDNNIDVPGKSAATASLVLGIISIVAMATWSFGIGSCVGVITGIIGLVCSSNAKREGYIGGMQTAGFICSLIGLIGGAFVLVICAACVCFIGIFGVLNML